MKKIIGVYSNTQTGKMVFVQYGYKLKCTHKTYLVSNEDGQGHYMTRYELLSSMREAGLRRNVHSDIYYTTTRPGGKADIHIKEGVAV